MIRNWEVVCKTGSHKSSTKLDQFNTLKTESQEFLLKLSNNNKWPTVGVQTLKRPCNFCPSPLEKQKKKQNSVTDETPQTQSSSIMRLSSIMMDTDGESTSTTKSNTGNSSQLFQIELIA